jgi:hypothetical protein
MKHIYQLAFASLILSIFSCTKDVGTVEATYFEATAIYGNLEKVRSTPLNESPRSIENPGKIYVGDAFILIGEEEKGIHIIENSIPNNPRNIGFINVPGNREFFVKDQIIYAESYYDVIKIDITDLLNVKTISRAKNVFNTEIKNNEGDALLGFRYTEVSKTEDQNSDLWKEINTESLVYYDFARNIIPKSAVPASFAGNSNNSSGTVNRITHHAGYLYIAGRFDIQVIKDDDPFSHVNSIKDVGENMETIIPYRDHLFIGTRASMEIFDLSVPERPTHQYRFDHATSCDPVLPADGAAYVSLRTADFSECPGNINAVIVLDISDLSKPVEVEEVEMFSPYGMAKIGNILYVGEGDGGLTAFDATDPLRLVELFHDPSIKAYDIMEHPTRTDLLLIAGISGLEQYTLENTLLMSLQSRIDY